MLTSPCDATPHDPREPQLDSAAAELLFDKLRRAFPSLVDANVVSSWACLRTFARDERFVIGPDPEVNGLIWVAGLGGHGMTTSPAVGRLGAAAVLGDETRISTDSPRRGCCRRQAFGRANPCEPPAPWVARSCTAVMPTVPFLPSEQELSMSAMTTRMPTRDVRVGNVHIGAGAPIPVQSMCATKTRDIDATVAQIEQLRRAGAAIVRVAVDNDKEVAALKEIRAQTEAALVVDLQENYRLAAKLGPYVDKIRYNPGHLHHVERDKTIADKVRLARRGRARQRLRHPRRRQLRFGGARVPGALPRRRARGAGAIAPCAIAS